MDRHAQTAPTPLEQVVDVIASPQIYTANADRLMQQIGADVQAQHAVEA